MRNLLIMVRAACDYLDDLPITRLVAEQAITGMRTDFERALNLPDYYGVLKQVEETQALPGSKYDQVLMYNMSILEYLNGEPCYVVNPVVQTLHKFQFPPALSTSEAPDNAL